MFEKTNVKVIGIIENMKSFISDDGKEHFIFGKDGGQKIAKQFNIDLLGQIPIDINLREKSDEGIPFVEIFKKSKTSEIFVNIVNYICSKIPCE
jgi:ATP-binding protein involved in chromosome partitioning